MYSQVLTMHVEQPDAALCWSPDGRHVAVASATSLRLIEIDRASEFVDLDLPAPPASEPFWGPGSDTVVLAFVDGSVGMWSQATGERLPLHSSNQQFQKVRWSRDGTMLASVVGTSVGLWDNYRNPPRRMLQAMQAVSALEWSPDSAILAAATRGTVMLWNRNTGALKRRLADAPADATALAWSQDGTSLAAASRSENTIRVWEVSSGAVTALLPLGEAGALSLSFSGCGDWLACASDNGETTVWAVADWRVRHVIKPAQLSAATSSSARFAPVTSRLAISEPEGQKLTILDLEGPREQPRDQPEPPPRRVFVSYARADRLHVNTLLMHLEPLKRRHGLEIWADHAIQPGASWNDEIRHRLATADIVLVLVSAPFLSSRYICEVELNAALSRRSQGLALVVPIILHACDWQQTELGALNALPYAGKPISRWKPRADAFNNVVEGLKRLFESPRTLV